MTPLRTKVLRVVAVSATFFASFEFCAPAVKRFMPRDGSSADLAQLWVDPGDVASRDMVYGPWGRGHAPDAKAVYTFVRNKVHGASPGVTVVDPRGVKWSVKQSTEGPVEVMQSRILSALGYHQPPVYYLGEWQAHKATSPNPQLPARFRERTPDLHGLDADGTWSYYRNPFVGTRQLNGLLTIQAMLGNSDLKDTQNATYTLKEPFEGARRWYVARDLGQSFGRTGVLDAPRGDVVVFERTPFIRGVTNGRVQFDYRGRHKVLFEKISPADVRWACEQLRALSDDQWHDAFRAGGFPQSLADRFIRRMKQKIDEGLSLKD